MAQHPLPSPWIHRVCYFFSFQATIFYFCGNPFSVLKEHRKMNILATAFDLLLFLIWAVYFNSPADTLVKSIFLTLGIVCSLLFLIIIICYRHWIWWASQQNSPSICWFFLSDNCLPVAWFLLNWNKWIFLFITFHSIKGKIYPPIPKPVLKGKWITSPVGSHDHNFKGLSTNFISLLVSHITFSMMTSQYCHSSTQL